MSKFKKVMAGLAFLPLATFAEGETATAIDPSIVTSYITQGSGYVVTVLTAGAAIVGAFYLWGLIKKALNRSK